jgi:hypothetical protein
MNERSRWTVLRTKRSGTPKRTLAYCRCVCGTSKWVNLCNVRRGLSLSCGCLRRENGARMGASTRKHGKSFTRLYRTWVQMKYRCHTPTSPDFARYGGRGIFVAEAWRASFEEFSLAVGPAPSRRHTLDRLDNARGYEPGNVRWATPKQQAANRRSTVPHLEDTRFGKVFVRCRDGHIRREAAWLCVCDCGVIFRTTTGTLRAGRARSCGCSRRKVAA